jgi:23S rRNA (guanine745-N1)-methyltransferase
MGLPDVIELTCPVRGCHARLDRGERQWRCPAGHSFDLARSGYCNLLQPNERRSRNPGDTGEAAKARRRLHERGVGRRFLEEIARILAEQGARGPILDAGCGEGFHLAALCQRLGAEGIGIDISTPSIELAARAYRGPIWVVANVDRRLPLADRSIGTLVSITSRVNGSEFARVARAGGTLVVATPGPDDLAELRARVLGGSAALGRMPDNLDGFELVRRHVSREMIDADRETIVDLLASTYRGQRRSQQDAAASLTALSITQSREIAIYRARG